MTHSSPEIGPAGKMDWVNCPICGEPDMRKSTTPEGFSEIRCVNYGCASNGGAMDARTPAQGTPRPGSSAEPKRHLQCGRCGEIDFAAGVLCVSCAALSSAPATPPQAVREAVIEECAKWHEHRAEIETNSLHCGDNSGTISAAHRVAAFHRFSARELRALSRPDREGK